MEVITIQRHGDGWKAHFHGEPERWEYGATKAEALGKLVISFPSRFGVEFTAE